MRLTNHINLTPSALRLRASVMHACRSEIFVHLTEKCHMNNTKCKLARSTVFFYNDTSVIIRKKYLPCSMTRLPYRSHVILLFIFLLVVALTNLPQINDT